MDDRPTLFARNIAPAGLGDAIRSKISDNSPLWDVLTKLAAPAAVAISAASYLSGYAYRYTLFRSFGFRPGSIEQSVQDTIATGYVALALALIVLMICLLFAFAASWIFTMLVTRSKAAIYVFDKVVNVTIKPLLLFNAFNAIITLMVIAVISGFLMGKFEANAYKYALNNGCKTVCSYYRLINGQMTGVTIGQSKDYTIIVGRKSAYLLQTSNIKSASPIISSGRWPLPN